MTSSETGPSRRQGWSLRRGAGWGARLGAAAAMTALVLAACSSGGGGGGNGGPGDTGAPLDSVSGGGGGGSASNAPSGGKVQVFNAYASKLGSPASVDVYTDSYVTSSSRPAMTIPYGTMSAQFDPGEYDASGNVTLTFLAAGVTDPSQALMTQQLTLAAGDVVTVLLTSASPMDDGTFGGRTNVFFNKASADSTLDTPPPGEGLLIVVSSGLDETLSSPDALSWYVSLGHGCDGGLGAGPGVTAEVSPGTTGTAFELQPGQVTVSIHTGAPSDPADCSNNPLVTSTVTAKAGVTDVLLLYGSDGDVRAEMVPLE